MPIKLTCNCGQVLNVPDALAGKTGKCPKCQAALRIPAASTAAAAAPTAAAPTAAAVVSPAAARPTAKPGAKPAVAKPAAAQARAAVVAPSAAQAPMPDSNMDHLFDELGMKKKTGPVCPKCGGPIQRTAALCTNCGFNLQTGEQAVGFEALQQAEEFKNPFLQEAADNMQREVVSEVRHAKAGTPWWMLASFLLGSLCIGAAGVIIVDATMNEPEPLGTFLGNLQHEKFGVVAGVTLAAVGSLISFFAHLSIVIFSFSESAGKGFAVLLVPFYNLYYGITTWADNKDGVYGLMLGGVLLGVGLWLNQYSGGVQGAYF